MPSRPTHQVLRLYQLMTGRRLLQRFQELERSQWLSRDELLTLQQAKLQRLVEYAYQHVPYYQRVFKELGFHPQDLSRDPASFRKLPFLTKKIILEHTEELFSNDPALRKTLTPHRTSGSTGQPLTFWEDDNQRDYVTAEVFRSLTWSGWRLGDPHGYLWGSGDLERAPWHHKLRQQMVDFTFNQFVVSAYNLSPAHLGELIRFIRLRKPQVLTGYTGALSVFAQHVKELSLSEIKFRALYGTAEVLYPRQRKLLEEVFGCRVFNRYATSEIGMIGCECEAHDGLHVSVESSYVEIVKGERAAADGEPGEIVVTNLNNIGFPLIRYRINDIVSSRSGLCSCGRQSPLIECAQGRTVDIFRTIDGRHVWGDFDVTLFQVEHVKQSQVIQKALDLVLVRIVKAERFTDSDAARIEDVIKRTLGHSVRVQFEFLDQIPQQKSGKFRYAYSELSDSAPWENKQ